LLAIAHDAEDVGVQDGSGWKQKTRMLFYSFAMSGVYVSHRMQNKVSKV
jgi:hypothetical protein